MRTKLLQTFRRIIYVVVEPVVGYTRLISFTKHGLWILAVGIVVWLLVMPLLNPVHERFNLTFSSIQTDASEKPQMLNPRFQGLDNSNQPFYITADTATQESQEVVLLDNVSGDITLNNGGWVSITAQFGTIFTDKDELLLERDVHLVMGDGNEFKTEKALLYMKESVVEGDQPIQGQGPSGTIDAGGFRIEDGGNRILFNKRVKMLIYPKTRG